MFGVQNFASICFRCRSLFRLYDHPERLLASSPLLCTQKRFRSGGNPTKIRKGPPAGRNRGWGERFAPKSPPPPQESIAPEEVLEYFEGNVKAWARKPHIRQRLCDFGIPPSDADKLLKEYIRRVEGGEFYANETKYNLARFSQKSILPMPIHVDQIYTNVLFLWASDPANKALIENIISPSTLDLIYRLTAAVDSTHAADCFSLARKMRRKIIMHVGPTNSGKTHNALRALAACRSGLYAGPLRLLAHEIWQRLNLGQIVPLGAEAEEPSADDLLDDILDIGDGKPAVHLRGDIKYARACNLLTGEEQKFVSEYAPLMSATVEMISFSQSYDVAVVDEVQMLADEHRGGAWTNAILGLAARELHLCGEETAIPLVEAMLKETGDELVINRYQRLAPLNVERHSLRGDLSKIRKGDCIVTFSRKAVFGLKRRVEEQTGLRCAVVYGRLPPEVRNSQAALFNDPDSGYDVLIGSDAIGMGLNLKIKRVILEAVRKFDGMAERTLSLSQTKQIAGRAGRYGAHTEGDENVGLVCTLREQDMPFLRRAVASPFLPLQYARLTPSRDTWRAAASVLPHAASLQTILDAHRFCARTAPIYLHCEWNSFDTLSEFLDTYASDLTISEKLTLMLAPVPWRDSSSLEVIGRLMSTYRDQFRVDLVQCLSESEHMKVLIDTEAKMADAGQPKSDTMALDKLETLHKILVLYMWMSLRHPVAWSSHQEVMDLKDRTEQALDWSLQGLSETDETAGQHFRWSEKARPAKDQIPFTTQMQRRLLPAA